MLDVSFVLAGDICSLTMLALEFYYRFREASGASWLFVRTVGAWLIRMGREELTEGVGGEGVGAGDADDGFEYPEGFMPLLTRLIMRRQLEKAAERRVRGPNRAGTFGDGGDEGQA